MGRSYYGSNGRYIDVNFAEGLALDKMAIGMFDKLGLPEVVSDEKIKEYAVKIRRIVNSLKDDEYLPEPEHVPVHLKDYYERSYKNFLERGGMINGKRIDVISNMAKKRLLDIAGFFETCGGLISEDEFYGKFGNGV